MAPCGQSLLTAFQIDNAELFVVLMYVPTEVKDFTLAVTVFKEAIIGFHRGFPIVQAEVHPRVEPRKVASDVHPLPQMEYLLHLLPNELLLEGRVTNRAIRLDLALFYYQSVDGAFFNRKNTGIS